MWLIIVNHKEINQVKLRVISFTAGPKFIVLKAPETESSQMLAALLKLGLQPSISQNGCQFILQTDEVHIKGGDFI